MAADATTKLDVTRAVGVLNAAVKHNMLPEGGIPETDDDKIMAAEQIIEMARQAHTIALQAGLANVPKHQAIVDVLAEAEVFLGIGSEPGPASPPDEQPVASVAGGLCGADDSSRPGIFCGLPPEHQGPHMGEGMTWDNFLPPDAAPIPSTPPGDASSTAVPSEVPPQTATSQPDDGVEYPQYDEGWLDANGNQWIVTQGGGGPQVEVMSMSGERTLVPSGFLKSRFASAEQIQAMRGAAQPPQEEVQPSQSQPSPQPPAPLPSPSAASSTPVSPTPAATTDAPQPSPRTSSPSPAAPSSAPSPSSSSTPSTPEPPPPATAPVDDDEGDPQYADLLEQVERDYMPTAMPVPMDLERPPESMPADLTEIGDLDQRRLHSQFNALSARARYLRGLEDAKARRIRRLRKEYMKIAMRSARAELGKDASVTEVTNLAEEDEDVKPWIERENRHAERADAYKTFFDMYAEHVIVLSRDWTMRDQEHRGS